MFVVVVRNVFVKFRYKVFKRREFLSVDHLNL